MKTVKTLTLLTICVASIALADDFKANNGKEYKDATVSRSRRFAAKCSSHSQIREPVVHL